MADLQGKLDAATSRADRAEGQLEEVQTAKAAQVLVVEQLRVDLGKANGEVSASEGLNTHLNNDLNRERSTVSDLRDTLEAQQGELSKSAIAMGAANVQREQLEQENAELKAALDKADRKV